MNIPRHWARATAEVPAPRGRPWKLSAWGWSGTGHAEALARAHARLAALAERLRQGVDLPRGYAYGERPLREDIVLEHRDDRGDVTAMITRNTYGALVLNTARALFIDVDLPPAPATGVLGRLFGRRPPETPGDAVGASLRAALLAAGAAFRIYRTAAGYRVLGTDRAWDPRSEATQALMERAGADPAFRHLCRVQESFRARLTPKPWRCGLRLPPGTHPRDDPRVQAEFARWLADYDAAARAKAVCRFVEAVGGDRVAPDVRPLLARHDEATRANTSLALA